MSGFGDGARDTADEKAGEAAGSKENQNTNKDSNNQSRGDKQGHTEQGASVSPLTWLSEIAASGNEQLKKAPEQLNKRARDLALDTLDKVLPLIVDAPVLPPLPEKSYSFVVDLNAEAFRKLPKAPEDVQTFYKEMRQAQLNHEPIGLERMRQLAPDEIAAYKDKWAEMNAWLAFPEKDADCVEGRNAYTGYIKRGLDRAMKPPLNEEEQIKAQNEDDLQLAKLYSLMLNDHDYLHNEAESTLRGGMHHLPEKFMGVGADGQGKEFNLKALAEKHMLALLKSTEQNPTYKSPLKPDERAALTFYAQVFRQVLPTKLLGDAQKGQRDAILADYVAKFAARDYDLSQAGPGVWQTGMDIANAKYPEMAKLQPGLQLTDAESLYEFFTLVDVKQLEVEAHEMRTIAGRLGKPSELAYPDQEHLHEFSKMKAPMREYREGQVLDGKRFLSTVFEIDPTVKESSQLTAKEQIRLNNWHATPNNWQLVYWHDNPNTRESKIQVEAQRRFPRSLQCGLSNEGADLLRKWMGPQGLFGNDGNRLVELSNSLCDAATKRPCGHDQEPRKKGKIK